jgi:hypothetical protein
LKQKRGLTPYGRFSTSGLAILESSNKTLKFATTTGDHDGLYIPDGNAELTLWLSRYR